MLHFPPEQDKSRRVLPPKTIQIETETFTFIFSVFRSDFKNGLCLIHNIIISVVDSPEL